MMLQIYGWLNKTKVMVQINQPISLNGSSEYIAEDLDVI